MDERPAGWYPDPASVHRRRWWDGTAWTAHTEIGRSRRHAEAPTAAPPIDIDELASRRSMPTRPKVLWGLAVAAAVLAWRGLAVLGDVGVLG